jgi:outer membrane immunogenic protein
MRISAIAAVAAVALLTGAAAANAADFNGPYVGFGGGLDKSDFSLNGGSNKDDVSATGFSPAVFGGYQKNLNGIILGAEADIAYNTSGYTEQGVHLSDDWNYGVKLRPGYAFTPNTAVFATAGLIWGDFRSKTPSFNDNETQFGYSLGGGLETYVNDRFSVRTDYEHGFFDDYHVNGVKVTPATDTFRVSVGYHFQ